MKPVKITWSVWDSSPVVLWSSEDGAFSVERKLPPIAVSLLPRQKMIAIVGDYAELGSCNLLFYSLDGKLVRTLAAPKYGEDSQFGWVEETENGLEVVVGYCIDGIWVEKKGKLDWVTGDVSELHGNYQADRA